MNIGVDLGTTYTKIAFFNQEGQLEQFRYPVPPNDHPYVPTAVAYHTRNQHQIISIGEAARSDAVNEEGSVFCENMKMLLPLKQEVDWKQHGWTANASPFQVMRDYLNYLLRESEHSFERRHGSIRRMVVSVPELWQRQTNVGAEALRQILVDDLQLPVDHLQSEPVCAAAYYIWHAKPDLSHPLHLLICDMGGGTFDMVLCRVSKTAHRYTIRVLDFHGSGQSGLGSAGVAFDQHVVRKVYQKSAKKFDPLDPEVVEDILAFEKVKLEKHHEAKRRFEQYDDPDLIDTPFYRWKRKYKITIDEVRESFSSIRTGMTKVIDELVNRARQQEWPIDRVVLVGGFSQFPLVEEAILDCLGIQDANDRRLDQTTLNNDQRFYAVSRGAALIANECVQIEEYYPHTLELLIHRQRPTLDQLALQIVEAGRMLAGRLQPYYAQRDGKDVIIDVQQQTYGKLPVQLRLMGTGTPIGLETSMTEFPPPGRYRVGVLVDRANLGILVFDPVSGGTQCHYPLGNISPEMPIEEA
ncbi:Hsp70 family protein [Candidatus Chloroploca sp. M-50]|uniref:Hsp70 family protein n=1 Tax=Candidatus Chloroploca mongolica TaxID=2528176 RepID=A0ABS4DAK9_9CHLR|nr:Hsp70 family protein [Candidatus Chloroploca mongolica]MBP1466480.1 Hsp70 family protein [Candidatus Chloroploca mongolica]